MGRSVLDTSTLIDHWNRSRRLPLAQNTAEDARRWARDLIRLRQTDAIVTPVALEVICGTQGRHELRLVRAYLEMFQIIDEGDVRAADWSEAARIAARVPRDGSPRQMGDCLIRAVSRRLRYQVDSLDKSFPA
jgi:predicted nucleic acid-binding protein